MRNQGISCLVKGSTAAEQLIDVPLQADPKANVYLQHRIFPIYFGNLIALRDSI